MKKLFNRPVKSTVKVQKPLNKPATKCCEIRCCE